MLVVAPAIVFVMIGPDLGGPRCCPSSGLMAGEVIVIVVIVAHEPRDGTRPATSPNRGSRSGTEGRVVARPAEIGTAMGADVVGGLLDEATAIETSLS